MQDVILRLHKALGAADRGPPIAYARLLANINLRRLGARVSNPLLVSGKIDVPTAKDCIKELKANGDERQKKLAHQAEQALIVCRFITSTDSETLKEEHVESKSEGSVGHAESKSEGSLDHIEELYEAAHKQEEEERVQTAKVEPKDNGAKDSLEELYGAALGKGESGAAEEKKLSLVDLQNQTYTEGGKVSELKWEEDGKGEKESEGEEPESLDGIDDMAEEADAPPPRIERVPLRARRSGN